MVAYGVHPSVAQRGCPRAQRFAFRDARFGASGTPDYVAAPHAGPPHCAWEAAASAFIVFRFFFFCHL